MQVPILPIAHNAGWVWPKGVMGKRPGTITMSIGKPIAPNAMNPTELMQVVENWIEDEVARLGPATAQRAEASTIACPPPAA